MDKLLPHQNLSLEDMDGEIWKDIEGYEGHYQISSFGRVKSLGRLMCRGYVFRMCKDTIRKITVKKDGYAEISLWIKNKSTYFRVHRLVALAFINNSKNKSEVNHINSNRLDNNVTNLEWTSKSENQCHANVNRKKTSKYVGVCYIKIDNKYYYWESYIQINNKKIHLGIYKTEEEAYQARCEYEKNNNIENKYL
jgi:hypothetical protein